MKAMEEAYGYLASTFVSKWLLNLIERASSLVSDNTLDRAKLFLILWTLSFLPIGVLNLVISLLFNVPSAVSNIFVVAFLVGLIPFFLICFGVMLSIAALGAIGTVGFFLEGFVSANKFISTTISLNTTSEPNAKQLWLLIRSVVLFPSFFALSALIGTLTFWYATYSLSVAESLLGGWDMLLFFDF